MSVNIKLEKQSGKSQPLYQQIRRQIRHSIETQQLKPGQRLPTVASLVKEWDVDFGTVKSAFDLLESDGLLKIEARKGAVVMNRVPVKCYTMMFIRWGSDALVVDIAEGLEAYCSESGQKAVCLDARLDQQMLRDAILHPPHDVDGLIVLPLDTQEYGELLRESLGQQPIVLVDRVLNDVDASSVTADHFAAGYRATRHLLEAHQLPVHFFGMVKTPSSNVDRHRGWAEAMRENGFTDLERYTIEMPFRESDPITYKDVRAIPRQLALDFFRENRKGPYSFIGSNDYLAQGFYSAAEELNMRVGKDVFVVGFGDLPFCSLMEPGMSSVYQPRKQLGYEAGRILHQQLMGQIKRPIHRILPIELKIRASSGV